MRTSILKKHFGDYLLFKLDKIRNNYNNSKHNCIIFFAKLIIYSITGFYLMSDLQFQELIIENFADNICKLLLKE